MSSNYLYIITIMFSFFYSNAIVSDSNYKSINYSFGISSDNQNLSIENVVKSKVFKANLNLVLKGKYEFGLNYLYNQSSLNPFYLPLRGSYNSLYLRYHFKERKKFPLNVLFDIEYSDKSFSKINYNSYGIGIYKEISLQYSVVPVFLCKIFQKFNSDYLVDRKYKQLALGIILKLPVITLNNSPMQDIIWIQPMINNINNDQFFSIDFGIYHPIN